MGQSQLVILEWAKDLHNFLARSWQQILHCCRLWWQVTPGILGKSNKVIKKQSKTLNNILTRIWFFSCQLRYPLLLATSVKFFDYNSKTFNCSHVYTKRSIYTVRVFGYDERYFSEAFLSVTIYKSVCQAPVVWIPKNQVGFLEKFVWIGFASLGFLL